MAASDSSIDPTRPLARIRLDGGEALDADPTALRRIATVLLAAEAVGVAERTLEASVAYAKVREQFGRPIGSFQAVKHRCADMAVRAEVARSLTTFAALALRDGEPVAGAARRLGEAETEPAELRRLAPHRLVERRGRPDQLADTCERETLREERADRVPDRLLFGAERQIHRVSAGDRDRARR